MPKLKFEGDELALEVGFILETCEELGVPFGCHSGNCGTCEIQVISGEEHLSPLSASEEDFGLEGGRRLACQCVIKAGDHSVEIAL
jgi:ferredoxin